MRRGLLLKGWATNVVRDRTRPVLLQALQWFEFYPGVVHNTKPNSARRHRITESDTVPSILELSVEPPTISANVHHWHSSKGLKTRNELKKELGRRTA